MKFSLLFSFLTLPGSKISQLDTFREMDQLVPLAEELGYHAIHVSEHHFQKNGWSPIPLMVLAKAAGLEIDDGIVVDEFARSSCTDVYAAGDCTVHPSLIYDRRIRLESVQNANDQGRVVAANICGKQIAYDAVPWFWSDQYDIKLQMVGLNAGYDEVVCRGDSSNHDGSGFALFYLKDSVLIAADCVSRPKEFVVAKHLVKNRVRLAATVLQDEAVEPANFAT